MFDAKDLITQLKSPPKFRINEVVARGAGVNNRESITRVCNYRAIKPDSRGQCVHQYFEIQAEQTPDAVAVIYGNQQLSYGELNRRANQLAHYLNAIEVGLETPVGVCIEPSVEMIIGLLAILKAGGVYVPLDPTNPIVRLATMVDGAGANVVLTRDQLFNIQIMELKDVEPARRSFSSFDNLHIFCLDTDWQKITEFSDENPTINMTGDNLAYIMYTSGSTGKPKGVAIPHRAITRLVIDTNYVQLQSSDRVAQVSNNSFDAATFEIWGALLSGACLVGIHKEVVISPHEFSAHISRYDISVLFLTTALFNLVASEAPNIFKLIRCVLFGGEAVKPKWVKRVIEGSPPERLLHVYGPTENTTFTSWYVVKQVPEAVKTIPIGRPISKSQTYLLDRNLQLVPVGIAGELYTGGQGLARGYFNSPRLTAERFIPNPFSKKNGALLYKTGDLARYQSDGNIEFIGRSDDQLKIRGFRIELSEIEAVVRQYHDVYDAIVIASQTNEHRDSKTTDCNQMLPHESCKLIAYVVSHGDQSLTTDDLRSYLIKRLPSYMLPSSFAFLDRLPLTSNGKVNRHALPNPDTKMPIINNRHVAPKDTLEIQLKKIWEQILNVPSVSVNDNFFALGGHSLMAVRLFTQIEKALGKKLPISALFKGQTIVELAELIRTEGWTHLWSSLVPIQPNGSKLPFFCIHAGGANVLFYRDLARYLGPSQPLYALQPQGLDGQRPEHRRVEDMAAHYIDEIRTIQSEGPYCLGGSSLGGTIAFEMARQLHDQGQKLGLVALFDTHSRGYPKYSDSTTSLQYHLYRTIRRIDHHLGSLWMLDPKDKLPYFVDKVKKAKHMLKTRALLTKASLAKKFYETIGQPLPASLRLSQNALREAANTYVPKLYSGRVTLFRASKQPLGIYPDPTLGWDGLAQGGLEIHEIPGQHGSIMVEPRVRFLVGKLRPCLERAQN